MYSLNIFFSFCKYDLNIDNFFHVSICLRRASDRRVLLNEQDYQSAAVKVAGMISDGNYHLSVPYVL